MVVTGNMLMLSSIPLLSLFKAGSLDGIMNVIYPDIYQDELMIWRGIKNGLYQNIFSVTETKGF